MALGFEGGPVFSTSIVPLSGGKENRNAWWTTPRHEYSYGFNGREPAELAALKEFFIAQRGAQHAWLLYDWLDNTLDDEPIGVGDGSDTTFAVIKTYAGAIPYERSIRHFASLVIEVEGTPVTVNSITAGVVTLATPPAASAIVTARGQFYVPVRFATDKFSAAAEGPLANYGSVHGLGAVEVLV